MHTAPATILLILTPYLTARSLFTIEALALAVYTLLAHYFSFGHNSLMDTYGGWDLKDPAKKNHPLVAGRISMTLGHNIIHWGLALLTLIGTLITLQYSPTPAAAMFSLLMWVSWGHAYNDGLDKESVLAFIPISLCITSAGAWGWLLSHETLDLNGTLYLAYTFTVILFQIAYSGCLKELAIAERSNILIKLGAKIEKKNGALYFHPSKARIFGWFVKGLNLLFAYTLLWQNYNPVRLAVTVIFSTLIIARLHQLTKPRPYIRDRELLSMSIMEILSIYLALWLLLDPLTAIILETFGIAYFFGVNKLIWAAPHPRV